MEKEVYSVLNPRGIIPEKEIIPLSARPSSLEGKTVLFVWTGAGNKNIMRSIADDFQAAVPGCNVVYHEKEIIWYLSYGEDEWKNITNADAVVIGHGF